MPQRRPTKHIPVMGMPMVCNSASGGWLAYEASPQDREATFYAWEAELNVTKSFSDRIAASADLDFYDSNQGARVAMDQLFISFLFPEWNDAIFTAGKFNAPYGIERHAQFLAARKPARPACYSTLNRKT